MNIVTFATPVSVAPPKLWVVSLYTNTLTRRAFLDSGVGVLQLLSPDQSSLVPILGKRSGYEDGFSKREECEKLGFGWVSGGGKGNSSFLTESDGRSPASFDLLPCCALYVKLRLRETMEAGDHDAALCEVLGIGVWAEETGCVVAVEEGMASSPKDPETALYTAQLRMEGII